MVRIVGTSPLPASMQLLGPRFILGVASREKGFVLERDSRTMEGMVVPWRAWW